MSDETDDMIEVSVRLPRTVVEAAVARPIPPAQGAARRLALAKWIVEQRRRRPRKLTTIRLGEPTWDMLLDLYVATGEDRRVDVMGMCLASGIAPTTAQRYVDILVADGHVAKVPDEKDHRRAHVTMSAELLDSIDEWLEQADSGLVAAGLIADGA